jgi:DNA topoisomerase-1
VINIDQHLHNADWPKAFTGRGLWRELGGPNSGGAGSYELRTLWPDKTGHDDHGRGSNIAHFVKATAAQRKELKLPPAWTNVLINPDPEGEVIAVGTDKKGRQQRRYSAAHSAAAAAEKFERLKAFNKILPGLREKVENDLLSDDPDVRESATLTRLIDRTAFRIGSNRDTMADKKAYGASTLRAYHVKVDGDQITFKFVGKKGVDIKKTVTDAKLARALEPRINGREPLFPTGADTRLRSYLGEHAPGFTPKDFRTYHGTAEALKALKKMNVSGSESMTKAQTVKLRREVGKYVAKHLGNTPAVSLSSYIDPAVFGKLVKP